MKSANGAKRSERVIAEFWGWFAGIERELHDAPDDAELLAQLERRLAAIHPQLAWEVGPLQKSRRMYLAVSPDLQHDLLELAATVCAAAHRSKLWEFLAGRPAKPWNKTLEIGTGRGKFESIDLSDWSHVLLQYPDGLYEVLLCAPWAAGKPKKLRESVAWIVAQNLLGERRVLESIDGVELSDELDEQFADSAKPLRQLARAFEPLES